MINLSEIQKQSLAALARLTKHAPQRDLFKLEEIRDERLKRLKKKEYNNLYLRSTKKSLEQARELIPMVVFGNAAGWKLSKVGKVVANTQLGVDL